MLAVGRVPDQYRDDLVVGLRAFDHTQSAHRSRFEKNFSSGDRPIGEYTDVQRIVVATIHGSAPRAIVHAATCSPQIRARDKAIKRGTKVREALRSVDFQVAGDLVDLILNTIRWRQFDVSLDYVREARSRVESVPWMWPELKRFHRDAMVARQTQRQRAAFNLPE